MNIGDRKSGALGVCFVFLSLVVQANESGQAPVSLGGTNQNSGQTSIFDDVRNSYNQAQHEVVTSVVNAAPSYTADLRGCVGDFGIDVSINPANWLNSIMGHLNQADALCSGDFTLEDVDIGGGAAPGTVGPGGGSGTALINIFPDVMEFGEIVYQHMIDFRSLTGFDWYPDTAIQNSDDQIMREAMPMPIDTGIKTVHHALGSLQEAFDEIDCRYAHYHIINADAGPSYCRGVKSHFEARSRAIKDYISSALQAYNNKASEGL